MFTKENTEVDRYFWVQVPYRVRLVSFVGGGGVKSVLSYVQPGLPQKPARSLPGIKVSKRWLIREWAELANSGA